MKTNYRKYPVSLLLVHRDGFSAVLKMFVGLIISLAIVDGKTDAPSQMSLETSIQLALASNYVMRIGEIEAQQAEEAIRIGGQALETTVSASSETFRSKNSGPSDYPYSAEGEQHTLAIQKRFSTGTQVEVSLDATSLEGTGVDNDFTGMNVGISQNLLRGRGTGVNRAPIRIASRRAGISHEYLRQAVIDTISEAQYAFYDALLAEANLRVANESLGLAQKLLSENQRRAEVGSIAKSDLLQAEAEVAARQVRLFQAEGTLIRATNRLKRVTSDEIEHILEWKFTIEEPVAPLQRVVDLKQAYQLALSERPDYRQAVLNLEISEIEKYRNRNLSLPAVDLYARMGVAGQSNSVRNSFNRGFEEEYPSYSVGLRVTHSIPNSAASARSVIARMENRRIELTLRQLEQAILLDLDSANAAITTNWKRLGSAINSRVLAEKSLEAEQKRYKTGTSSTFILIRLQTDLVNSQIRELVAMNDYRKSLVEFDRQTAGVLESMNIQL